MQGHILVLFQNRVGARSRPCFIPVWMPKLSDTKPFDLIVLLTLSWKLTMSFESRKGQLILSTNMKRSVFVQLTEPNAFVKSTSGRVVPTVPMISPVVDIVRTSHQLLMNLTRTHSVFQDKPVLQAL